MFTLGGGGGGGGGVGWEWGEGLWGQSIRVILVKITKNWEREILLIVI